MNVNIPVRPTFTRIAFNHKLYLIASTATLPRFHPLLNNRERQKIEVFGR